MSLFVLLALFTSAAGAVTQHHECLCFPPPSVPQTAFCSNSGLKKFRGCRPLSILGLNPLSHLEKLFGSDSFANRQHYRLQLVLLDRNSLQEISGDSFSDLKNLEEIDLSHNIIQKRIPTETFHNNTKLRSINLSHNNLGAIDKMPVVVSQTAEILKATNCGLVKIDSSTFVLPNLRTLNLSKNDINVFETLTLKVFSKISTLDLSFNNITIVSVNFSVAVNLEVLDLSHNNLRRSVTLPLLSHEYLQTLNVSGCGLKTITNETFNVPKLITLNISNNEIEILSEYTFNLMTHLNSLDISRNKIKSLDFTLNVANVVLFGNPWTCDCEYLNPYMTSASFENAFCLESESINSLPVSKFHNGDYCCKIKLTIENSDFLTTTTDTSISIQKTELFFPIKTSEVQETSDFQKITDIISPLQSSSQTFMTIITVCVIWACICIVYFTISNNRQRNSSTRMNKSIIDHEMSIVTYKKVTNDSDEKIVQWKSSDNYYVEVTDSKLYGNDYTSDPTENIYEEILD